MSCDHDGLTLQAWFDGENAPEAASWAANCASCAQQIEAWTTQRGALQQWVKDAAPESEPLLALQSIRQRIAHAESQAWPVRLRTAASELWRMHHRALLGAAVAVVLGVLSAPWVLNWMQQGTPLGGQGTLASVVIESLEFDGDAEAKVLTADGGDTTIIWIEPRGDEAP